MPHSQPHSQPGAPTPPPPGQAPHTGPHTGGGTAVLDHPETTATHQPATPWTLIVLNDDVTLATTAVLALVRVLKIDQADAWKHVITIDQEGRDVVYQGTKDDVMDRAEGLMSYHLTVRVEATA